MRKELWLIRHGEPDYPGGIPVCMGQTLDYPLSAAGRKQAEELASAFPVRLDAVYSSPRRRALETALPLARVMNCPLLPENSLRELSSGVWEGMTFQQMHTEYAYCFEKGNHLPPPGGESDEEGLERLLPFLKTLEEAEGNTFAAVGHSGLFRALAARLAGIPLSCKRSIPFPLCGMIPLRYDGSTWSVAPGFLSEIPL